MEQVEQALKRAKVEQQHQAFEQGSSSGHQPCSVEAQFSATDKRICYTQTHRIVFDERVLNEERIIAGRTHYTHESNKISSAYKILRTQVLQRLKARHCNNFGIVSANPGEGKSLTAINLAISLAQEVQHTVLLVDFDLKNPSIHTYFKYCPGYCLNDYLFNDVPLPEIMFNPGIEGLVVLPGSDSVPNSSEMLSSPKVGQLVEELKSRYAERIVIFDLPSLLSSDDVMAFSPYVDSVLLVVEDGRTTQDELMQSLEYLGETEILATVLNKSKSNKLKLPRAVKR